MPVPLEGTIPPVIAPLAEDRTVDVAGVRRVTEHLLAGGVDGLFVLGSCGEGPTLRRSVADALVAEYVRAADGRVPVLAGVGETSTERAIEALRAAEDAGASGIVAMAPMYFLADGDGEVIRHLEAVAAATTLPVVVYNIPHLTGHPITPAALAAVAAIDNVVALKESSGIWEIYEPLARTASASGLAVFQGAESLIARSIAAGADGAVPGIANVAPGLAVELVRAARARDASADDLQARLDAVCDLYSSGFWLASLKYAVSVLGLAAPTAGAALPGLAPEGERRVRDIVGRTVGTRGAAA
ncbi:MAG: dihydrodipicolinate synthase family protein [Microbacterium sp.]|nr:dihydrodipicolinate synthase family protein [Microbacterium sp.]